MYMVRNYKELSYEDREVLSCHFHLHNPYNCVQAIEQFWNRWCESVPWRNVQYFGLVFSFTVRTDYLIDKSNVVSIHQWTPYCVGENVMSNKESTVCGIDPDRVDRRFFPPQQQHEIIALATQIPVQQGHPITHWSISDLTRSVLENEIVGAIAPSTIWRLLDQAVLKPHRWHYWLNSPDPEFYPKMYAIIELYLNALDMYERGEIVLSVDEKTSIQALQRKYPHKPMIPGRVELIEHEYKRHGTCCLTAGLEVATGEVMGLLTPNRPAEVFAEFIQWVCRTYAEAPSIHIVLDNLNTHYHALTCQVVADFCHCPMGPIETGRQRKVFLADPSKRVVFHFTPSHASWLNQVEIWFSTLVRKVIRRGDFSSVDDLQDKIIRFIEYYNEYLAKPYKWTYTGKPLAVEKKAA
jgi:hypothetical protein